MSEISRTWWIGYFTVLFGEIAVIALAAWLLLQRPEAPPPPPVVVAEAPPSQPLQFRYPAWPDNPDVRMLLRKLDEALNAIPSCRFETEWTLTFHAGATPADRRETGGQILSKSRLVRIIKGDNFWEHFRRQTIALHPELQRSDARRVGISEHWELQNNQWYAQYVKGEAMIIARPIADIQREAQGRQRGPRTPAIGGFHTRLHQVDEEHGYPLQWTTREEGGLVIIAGEPMPDRPEQQVRCEIAMDPARDHLVVRESYWLQDALHAEEINELQQLPDGRWFPLHNESRNGDTVSQSTYSNVEVGVAIDDSQFALENIPCDLNTVLVHVQRNWDRQSREYLRYNNGQWEQAPLPAREFTHPKGKIERAEPKEENAAER